MINTWSIINEQHKVPSCHKWLWPVSLCSYKQQVLYIHGNSKKKNGDLIRAHCYCESIEMNSHFWNAFVTIFIASVPLIQHVKLFKHLTYKLWVTQILCWKCIDQDLSHQHSFDQNLIKTGKVQARTERFLQCLESCQIAALSHKSGID